ncbi:MAG UNVERIFIED_CONTAM: hypothetical protein LVT10_24465 [Anaerolineae bacterium]|jgi:ATPase subunit of ABC transporter with duplicated ATPase domains
MHILKLSQVSLSFPNRALLRAVNLDIDSRARMGLVGANGCRKVHPDESHCRADQGR